MAKKSYTSDAQVEAPLESSPSTLKAEVGLNGSNQPSYDDAETKRILKKVDWRLLPLLACLYLLAFLDRGNIANANVAGMNGDLNLSGAQYNMALTVFFFPYAVFEVPSNIVLKLIRPSLWISIIMVAWGIVMTCQGVIKTYEHLIITRTLLGLFESGFFPAATYLLTTWYCRFEVQTRLAIFFSAASAAGAFSGLLAYAIVKMDGVGGYAGWRWIFILEGILTVVVGAVQYWMLPDSPQTASFLEPWEAEFINRRLAQDSGTSTGEVAIQDKFSWEALRSAILEWKLWLAVIVYWGNSIPVYGFNYSVPAIIRDLGYSAANAQLLTVPPYTLAAISTVVFALWADKRQRRWPFIMGPYSIALIGFVALLAIPQPKLPGLTYAFLFCIPSGTYPASVGTLVWLGNNVAPSWKRAVAMALLISMGNLGGAIGCNIYLQRQAPTYWLGYGLSFGILFAAISCTWLLKWAYEAENKKRDLLTESEVREKYTEDELLRLGDKSPLYRYVV